MLRGEKIMVRSSLKTVVTLILSLALIAGMMPLTGQAYAETGDGEEDGDTIVSLAILSDIHYVSKENREGAAQTDLENAAKAENRLMSEIGLILDQALT